MNKNKIEKFWDKAARNFHKDEERFAKAYAQAIEHTRTYLDPEDIVIDFGCGPGTICTEIADNVQHIHALDISPKMIEIAKRKTAERKIQNIDFSQASLFDERFQKGTFDVVLAFNILHLLENSRQIVDRITELLKPGGLFISTTACLGEEMDLKNRVGFSFFLIIKAIGLLPVYLKKFKIHELEELIASGNLEIIESIKHFHGITGDYIVARKM